jgi:hypothetical protein
VAQIEGLSDALRRDAASSVLFYVACFNLQVLTFVAVVTIALTIEHGLR